jgi:hypothetical protein
MISIAFLVLLGGRRVQGSILSLCRLYVGRTRHVLPLHSLESSVPGRLRNAELAYVLTPTATGNEPSSRTSPLQKRAVGAYQSGTRCIYAFCYVA